MTERSGWRHVEGLVASELEGRTFACLEGCGFCCTFQPEASQRELALLRARLKPRPLAIAVGDGRSYLGLQKGCGACTLLERRACMQYDLRPKHCRYFPFHVHFGRAPEVYVNYTCRGVEHRAGMDVRAPFASQVLEVGLPEEVAEHARAGREAYAQFERRARKAGAWGDARAIAREALQGASLSRAWMDGALERANDDATADDMVEDALAPFAAEDLTKRPFYLAPDLQWLTFDGPTRLRVMDEQGDLSPVRELPEIRGWADVHADLVPYWRALTDRGVFEGSVYALVDDSGYQATVEEATWWRLAEIAADLAVRARILAAMGVEPSRIPDETSRFYDSTFLDSRSIGGFL